jgi:hypothetical protein
MKRLALLGSALLLWTACSSSGGGDNGSGGVPGQSGGRGGSGSAGRGGSGGLGPGTGGSSVGSGGSSVGSGGSAGGSGGSAGGGGQAGTPDGPVGDMGGAGGAGPADGPPVTPPAAGECANLLRGTGPASQWVSWDAQGKLVYKPLNAQGDRIMDFSNAGYRGGGVALPEVPVAVMLSPSGADDTAAIRAAIDEVSRRPLVNGARGAVLLRPGKFQTSSTITVSASGVVIRGSGSGAGGTEIQLTGTPHRFMIFQGSGTRMVDAASKVTITDDHVAAGTRTFTVDNASAFKVGDEVLVGRPVTAKWVSFMRMDLLVRNGAPQNWISVGSVLNAERVITAIEGNKITVDIPLSDSMAGEYVKPPGGSLTKYKFDRLSEIGIEHLRVVGQPRTETVNFNFLSINTVVDAWVKDVVAHDVTTGVGTNGDAKRITIEDTTISHTTTEYVNPAKPADFNIDASQVLIHRSASRGSNRSFSMITQSGVAGPTVVLNFAVSGISPPIQPHQRWATGLLVDNANMEQGGIEFINRGTAGSGHGWSIGWGVAWNSTAASINLDQPPGSMVWANGCKGNMTGGGNGDMVGLFESHGTPVNIKSLYLAQLCERLGPQALANIGYKLTAP